MKKDPLLSKVISASHSNDVDAIFDAFAKLAEVMYLRDKENRERKKEQQKIKLKADYARKKAAGMLPKKKVKVAERADEPPTSCSCQTCGMPPCFWCTDIATYED